MRHSQMLIPTLKEEPADAQVISHKLMMRAGMIRKVAAGIYNYLPLGLRVIQKVSNIVREEMNRVGAQEILMPMVQPAELWKESGRWDDYDAIMLRFKDAKGADFCLGPTHEEVVTALVRDQVKTYRQLPISLYQIQGKFRDEIRPRFGLMRGREFLMKDAYSFDVDQKEALNTYDRMYGAYKRIFERFGLKFRPVAADTGSIGGNRSHEFQVLAETGEDQIAACSKCDYAANVEFLDLHTETKREKCPKCGAPFEMYRGIEVGHVFYLGTKYSQAMGAQFLDENGKEQPMEMGCYGIGISRTAAAAIEQNHDEKGICWPMPIAPFHVALIRLGKEEEVIRAADKLYESLLSQGVEVLYDDRDERPGVKFAEHDLIGCPLRITIGSKSLKEGVLEIKFRKETESQKVKVEEGTEFVVEQVRRLLQI